jgi:hypothetical protein
VSQSRECEYFTTDGGAKHYYVIQEYGAPYLWDWREGHCWCFGPFASEDDARDHQCDNHSNPGGSEMQGEIDPAESIYARLLASAIPPNAPRDKWKMVGW